MVTLQPVAFVPLEGETFTTDVTVENTKDLLGFQFDVNFDPAAFALEFDGARPLPEQHRPQRPAAGARPARRGQRPGGLRRLHPGRAGPAGRGGLRRAWPPSPGAWFSRPTSRPRSAGCNWLGRAARRCQAPTPARRLPLSRPWPVRPLPSSSPLPRRRRPLQRPAQMRPTMPSRWHWLSWCWQRRSTSSGASRTSPAATAPQTAPAHLRTTNAPDERVVRTRLPSLAGQHTPAWLGNSHRPLARSHVGVRTPRHCSHLTL